MTTVPLGLGAFKRNFAGEPDIRMVNRFMEENPTNLREHASILSRPGTKKLAYFTPNSSTGVIRALYSKPGLFKSDLFVVSGENLYRHTSSGSIIQIAGVITGTGRTFATWQRGVGYEYLFISDGQLLQYYDGGSRGKGILTSTLPGNFASSILTTSGTITNQVIRINNTYFSWNDAVDTGIPDGSSTRPFLAKLNTFATGVLTLTGSITNQVIQIGTLFYSWSNLVDAGTPDGTSTKPFLAKPGTDPLAAMVKLLNFTGTSGVDFSSGITAANSSVRAASAGGPPGTTMTLTSIAPGIAGNAIVTAIFAGAGLAWGAATLTGGLASNPLQTMANLLNFTGTRGVDFSTALTVVNPSVSATVAGGPPATSMAVLARQKGTVGNAIVTTVFSGANLSWSSGTLTGGSLITDQIIRIGSLYYGWNTNVETGVPNGTLARPFLAKPGNDPITALSNLLSFIGTPGTDFSSAITGPSLVATAVATGGTPATILTLTSVSDGLDANSIATVVTSGTAGLSWADPTLLGGGSHTLHGIYVPTGEGIGPLATLASYVVAVVTDTRKFFYLRPGATVISALDFAEKESNPDPIADVVTVGDFMMLIGKASMESWYATGSSDNPLSPVAGRTVARGAISGTVVNIKDSVVLVGDDGIVYLAGANMQRISTHGVEERIRTQIRREKGLT